MLQTIRDRSQGLIVGVIVFLISLTFALWGIQSYIDGGSQVVVAEAAGEEILLGEFQDSLQRFRRQAQSVLGDSFDANAWDSVEVRRRALDELIDERIVDQVIDDARIRISDAQVANQLQQIPSFQDENGFSRQLYEQRVPLLGLSQAGFEQKLRNDMARAQLRAGVAASEFVTSSEAEYIESLRKQKRDIGYAIIPAGEFADTVALSDAEIEAYFDKNRESYRVAERVKLEYLEISATALQDEIEVSDAVLRDYYAANKAAFTVAEERNANHILVQLPQSAGLEEEAGALAKIAIALSRAKDGEPFEELAKELSDDVGSSAGGGETGFFPRDAMVKEFEDAAFALNVGEISEPVRTQFGFHIIKLKAIKPGGLKPFEEVYAEVESAYRQLEAQKLFFEQADQFSNLVYEHPDSLEVAAEGLGLEIKHTKAMTESEITTEFSDKLASRAFETEVLLERLNAEPVELADGRVIAIRVGDHEPSRIPLLTEVHSEVEQTLRTEKLRELTKAAAVEMVERLRGGESVKDVVEQRGFGWERASGVTRESNEVNRAVLRAAFRLEAKSNGASYDAVAIGLSDYAVVEVAKVATPQGPDLSRTSVGQVKQELIEARAETVWREFLLALRGASDVSIYKENL